MTAEKIQQMGLGGNLIEGKNRAEETEDEQYGGGGEKSRRHDPVAEILHNENIIILPGYALNPAPAHQFMTRKRRPSRLMLCSVHQQKLITDE